MKKIIYLMFILAGAVFFNSCSDNDDNAPGNPVMDIKTTFGSALFGDSLPFTVNVSDGQVPLSTLKVQIYYGEEMVSEKVIRTKTDGEYSGKIFVPYYANIPNATATLRVVLQNIHFTITEKSFDLPLSRPDFPYLTLVTADKEFRMERTGLYEYAIEQDFPMKMPGYIKAPVVGTNGNEITFGWEESAVIQGSTTNIPYSNFPGTYAITFNTLTYATDPFVVAYTINGVALQYVDDNNYKLDMDLTQGQELEIEGIDNVGGWWIDPDFFTKEDDGKLKFVPVAGSYRIIANFEYEYFRVEVLKDGSPATLQSDGTGAIWVIGDKVGKPSVAVNAIGWGDQKALCMAPIGNKKYQISLKAGTNITTDDINFKFFHQKGWGGEFGGAALSTDSDYILVNPGPSDDGNIKLVEGKTLTSGKTYVFTVDVSQGNDKAVLTVVEK